MTGFQRFSDSAGPHHVLVVGRSGQVATELARAAWPTGWAVTCLGRDRLDITRPETVGEIVSRFNPSLVVNAAAYTAIDAAEIDAQHAFAVNGRGAGSVAAASAALGIPLIHLSADYVFDGAGQRPYREDDPVNPLSVCGASKESGERAVRAALDEHVILRTSWIYGAHGSNFATSLLRHGSRQPELAFIDDQTSCPTAATDIARTVVEIARQLLGGRRDGFGTYHYCSGSGTTWFRFVRALLGLAAETGLPVPRVRPIATADRPMPAPRPRWSVLDCRRIAEIFGIEVRPWQVALTENFHRLLGAAVLR